MTVYYPHPQRLCDYASDGSAPMRQRGIPNFDSCNEFSPLNSKTG